MRKRKGMTLNAVASALLVLVLIVGAIIILKNGKDVFSSIKNMLKIVK